MSISFSRNCFTLSETKLLLNVIEKYRGVICNRLTNAEMNKKKDDAWKKVCAEFNAVTTEAPRTVSQLKTKFTNLKKIAKKNNLNLKLLNTKIEEQKTAATSLEVLRKAIETIEYPCDSDTNSEQQLQTLQDQEFPSIIKLEIFTDLTEEYDDLDKEAEDGKNRVGESQQDDRTRESLPLAGTEESLPLAGSGESLPLAGTSESLPLVATGESLPLDGIIESLPLNGTINSLLLDGTIESLPFDGTRESEPGEEEGESEPVDGTGGSQLESRGEESQLGNRRSVETTIEDSAKPKGYSTRLHSSNKRKLTSKTKYVSDNRKTSHSILASEALIEGAKARKLAVETESKQMCRMRDAEHALKMKVLEAKLKAHTAKEKYYNTLCEKLSGNSQSINNFYL